MHPLRLIVSLAAGLTLAIGACKEAATEDANTNKGAIATTTTTTTGYQTGDSSMGTTTAGSTTDGSTIGGTTTAGTTTDCFNTGSTGLGTTTGNGTLISGTNSSGLGLDQAVYFEPDIRMIVSNKCGSCHQPGNKQPELDTFQKLAANATAVVSAIESDRMPPGGDGLSTAERRKIKAWVAAGFPQSSMSPTTGLSTSSTTSNGSVNPCDQTTGVGTTTSGNIDTTDGWNELINPPALNDCHNRSLVYDRSGEKCLKARIATSYQCTHQGVLDKFKAVKVDITSNLAQIEADGYVIDQCGEYNNEPIVLFYKKQEADNELKLLFKKFCKKGSDACTN